MLPLRYSVINDRIYIGQRSMNNNSLIIRPKAKPNEFYILVIDEAPNFKILGFVNSTYVLGQDRFKTDFGLARPPCYSIPPDKLTPINLLKDSSWN